MFYQKLAFTIHEKNIKKSYKNNRLKIPVPTWNKKFDLHDGLFSVSDIEDYFELLTTEIKKFLESTKSKISKDKNGKHMPYLEITEVDLIHCNVVNNIYP